MIESEYLKNLVAKAKKLQKTIVLPEGEDERILKAAHIIAKKKLPTWLFSAMKRRLKTILPKTTGA